MKNIQSETKPIKTEKGDCDIVEDAKKECCFCKTGCHGGGEILNCIICKEYNKIKDNRLEEEKKNSDEKQIKEALDIALDGPNYGDSIYLENSTKGMLHHIVGTRPCRFLLNLGDGNFKIYTLGDGVESLIKYNSEEK